MSESRTPSLAAAFRTMMLGGLDDVHTCMAGRVTEYDASTRKATVAPLVGRGYVDEDGNRQVEYHPPIPGVPVLMPGSGGTRVKFPVNPGDVVLLVIGESSHDLWKARGGQVDPGDDRRFNLSDAFAIAGLDAFGDVADATTLIEFTDDGKIQIGSGPFVATGPTGDQLVKAGAIDPFTGQTQAVLNPTNLTTTTLAK